MLLEVLVARSPCSPGNTLSYWLSLLPIPSLYLLTPAARRQLPKQGPTLTDLSEVLL